MSSDSPQSGAKAIAEPDEATVPKSTEEQPMIVLPSDATLLTRQNSLSSSSSKTSDCPDICRICHCEGTDDEPLISPCLCLGTMQYLHQFCLQRWIKSAGVKSCELCKFEFIMHSEIKPFKQVDLFPPSTRHARISNARCFQWQKLDMNIVERRKVMCSVAFNLIAVTCVLWSLYVLIEKTREEVKAGKLRKIKYFLWISLLISSSRMAILDEIDRRCHRLHRRFGKNDPRVRRKDASRLSLGLSLRSM